MSSAGGTSDPKFLRRPMGKRIRQRPRRNTSGSISLSIIPDVGLGFFSGFTTLHKTLNIRAFDTEKPHNVRSPDDPGMLGPGFLAGMLWDKSKRSDLLSFSSLWGLNPAGKP